MWNPYYIILLVNIFVIVFADAFNFISTFYFLNSYRNLELDKTLVLLPNPLYISSYQLPHSFCVYMSSFRELCPSKTTNSDFVGLWLLAKALHIKIKSSCFNLPIGNAFFWSLCLIQNILFSEIHNKCPRLLMNTLQIGGMALVLVSLLTITRWTCLAPQDNFWKLELQPRCVEGKMEGSCPRGPTIGFLSTHRKFGRVFYAPNVEVKSWT